MTYILILPISGNQPTSLFHKTTQSKRGQHYIQDLLHTETEN